MQLKLILCPIDFSEFSTRAHQYVLSLAEYYQAKLVALRIVELWKYPFADYAAYEGDFANFSRAPKGGGEVRLREFVRKHTDNKIHPQLVVDQGNASDLILSFAQAQNMELIVMGTHGRRGFDRLVLGSVTDRVMRKASCPGLAISKPPHASRAAGPDGRHVHHISRILYCTDFSANSEPALNYAISATAEYDAELTLLHVLEELPTPGQTQEAVATAARQLDKLITAEQRKAIKIKTAVRVGKPYEEIVQHTLETHADLVAMGVRGAGALDAAVFGSTTYRVIQLGPCPVLAVHV
jgi:nucleotide-binding universal stress UspA family protein